MAYLAHQDLEEELAVRVVGVLVEAMDEAAGMRSKADSGSAVGTHKMNAASATMSCESATVMRAHGCSAVLAKSPPWLSSSFVPKFISALYRRYPP